MAGFSKTISEPDVRHDRTAAVAEPAAKPAASNTSRISALDFTKGALVLFMVLYHWLNYFVAAQGFFYRYLRFLTPSFIFIAGFLVSNIYFPKYRKGDQRVPGRLLVRGAKILALFLVLNLAIEALISLSTTGHLIPDRISVAMPTLYIFGTTSVAGVKAAVFYVLIPISYLLMVSAPLLRMTAIFKYTFQVAALLCLLTVVVLNLRGNQNPNLELVGMGLLGVLAGYVPLKKIDWVVRHPSVLLVAYALYLGAITLWNTPYLLQIIGVCLTLLVLYAVGSSAGEPDAVRSHTMLLGKYSLFGYIAQMVFLQGIHRFVRHIDFGDGGQIISCVLGFALTIASIEVLDLLRRRSGAVDAVYKTVFA